MSACESPEHEGPGAALRRRKLLAMAVLTPAVARLGVADARAEPARTQSTGHLISPVPTTRSGWAEVTRTLGRSGNMIRGLFYHTPFPRWDLRVVSRGITVTPGLALGSHASFVRYGDGSVMVMGDLVVTERQLQTLTDAVQSHGFVQTAIHKHLLEQTPAVWWTHIHAHGHDPVDLARRLRAVMEAAGTPPPSEPASRGRLDLDTAGIDAALGASGTAGAGVYTCTFIRRETVVDDNRALPPGLGATTAFNFQPIGGGRAALNGDFVMIASEVQDAIGALRRGSVELVELHNHGLTEEPRLFFTHIWAVGDAVALARALRPAVAATNVVASSNSAERDAEPESEPEAGPESGPKPGPRPSR
ncbi:peptidase M23 [Streptomyces griseocarneus]|nr:peptidase M23 [Streptomyces griseocarneus]